MPGLLALYLVTFLFSFTFIGAASFRWYFAPLVLAPWTGIAFLLMKIGSDRLEKMDV